MDPLDCDGEANPRPISADIAKELVAVAAYFTEPDNDEPGLGRRTTPDPDCGDVVGFTSIPIDFDDDALIEIVESAHTCSLCGCGIAPLSHHAVWAWNEEILHAHLGCDAIRREIDLGEWTQGDLVDRLVEWHQDDPLNRDLGELDAGLTPEQRDDMGGEIIAAALRSIADDSDTDVDSDGCAL